MQYVADMFDRARVKAHSKDKSIDIPTWAENNKHMNELKNMATNGLAGGKGSLFEDLQAALSSYSHRVSPALMLSPTHAIVDSLPDTCQTIADICAFVVSLAKSKDKTQCPFQFDAVFAFNNVRDVGTTALADDDDYEEDDDDDDDGSGAVDKPDENSFYDVLGDVKKKLASEKCAHSAVSMNGDAKDDEKSDNANGPKRARLFGDAFKKFRTESIETKYKGKKEYANYPWNKRFNAFIDKRKPDDKDNNDKNISKDDELVFFEPTEDANKLTSDGGKNKNELSPMVFFDRSRTVLIPSEGYNAKIGKSDDEKAAADFGGDQKKKLLNEAVNSLSKCNGAIMTFSFHVAAKNEIRCYCYMNGQVIRFMPEDVLLLLPIYFDDEFGSNAKWKDSKAAKDVVEQVEKSLKDVKFD